MGRYAKRKPGLNEGQDCCPCITLHIPLFLYVQLGVYKLILKVEFLESCTDAGLPHVVLFFFRLNSHLEQGGSPRLLICLLRSVRERAQGGALSDIQRDAGGLTWMVQVPCLELYWFSL